MLAACELCGAETERIRSRGGRTRTCGASECRGELQRRRNLRQEAAKREGIAARLRAIGPGALAGLAPAERELEPSYYGLEGMGTGASPAEREAELTGRLGLSPPGRRRCDGGRRCGCWGRCRRPRPAPGSTPAAGARAHRRTSFHIDVGTRTMAQDSSRRSLVTCLGPVAVLTLPLSTAHAWSIEWSRKLEPDARVYG